MRKEVVMRPNLATAIVYFGFSRPWFSYGIIAQIDGFFTVDQRAVVSSAAPIQSAVALPVPGFASFTG